MELPTDVLIHSQVLGLKGSPGVLLRISEHGYYEANVPFGDRQHRVLLPVSSTVVIQREAEEQVESDLEIER